MAHDQNTLHLPIDANDPTYKLWINLHQIAIEDAYNFHTLLADTLTIKNGILDFPSDSSILETIDPRFTDLINNINNSRNSVINGIVLGFNDSKNNDNLNHNSLQASIVTAYNSATQYSETILDVLNASVSPKLDEISAGITGISSDITAAVGAAISGVGNQITEMASSLPAAITDAVTTLSGDIATALASDVATMSAVQGAIIDQVATLPGAITAGDQDVMDAVASHSQDLTDVINSGFADLGAAAADNFLTASNHLFDPLDRIDSHVTGELSGIKGLWKSYMDSWVTNIWPQIQGGIDAIGNWLKEIFDQLLIWNAQIHRGIINILVDIGKIILEKIWPAIKYVIEQAWNAIEPVLKTALDVLTPILAEIARAMANPPPVIFGAVDTFVTTFATNIIRNIENVLSARDVSNPENAISLAADAISMATTTGMTAHIIAATLEGTFFYKYMGASNMAALLVDVAGYQPIVNATWSTMVRESISKPLGYYYGEKFRPMQFDPATAERLLQEREISEDEYRQACAYAGYRPELIERLLGGVYREPGVRDIARLAEDASMSIDGITTKMQRTGYSDQDAAAFASILVQKVYASDKRAIISEVISQASQGLITSDVVDSIIDAQGLRPEHVQIINTLIALKANRDDVIDLVKLAADSYYNGFYTKEDFSLSLAGFGLTDSKVQIEVAKVELKLNIKAAKEETSAIKKIIRAEQLSFVKFLQEEYKQYLIDDHQFINSLIESGFNESYANLIVSLASLKRKPPKATAAAAAGGGLSSFLSYTPAQ